MYDCSTKVITNAMISEIYTYSQMTQKTRVVRLNTSVLATSYSMQTHDISRGPKSCMSFQIISSKVQNQLIAWEIPDELKFTK